MMMLALLHAYMPGQYSHPAGLQLLPLNYQSPLPREWTLGYSDEYYIQLRTELISKYSIADSKSIHSINSQYFYANVLKANSYVLNILKHGLKLPF